MNGLTTVIQTHAMKKIVLMVLGPTRASAHIAIVIPLVRVQYQVLHVVKHSCSLFKIILIVQICNAILIAVLILSKTAAHIAIVIPLAVLLGRYAAAQDLVLSLCCIQNVHLWAAVLQAVIETIANPESCFVLR